MTVSEYECPLVVLACESLHVCTVCIWRCEHARFCVDVFYALYINFHSFNGRSSRPRDIFFGVSQGSVHGLFSSFSAMYLPSL